MGAGGRVAQRLAHTLRQITVDEAVQKTMDVSRLLGESQHGNAVCQALVAMIRSMPEAREAALRAAVTATASNNAVRTKLGQAGAKEALPQLAKDDDEDVRSLAAALVKQ